ncbi:MAG TPA: ribosome-associated translation inhibitor RaiA [Pseudonocardiaceae bacterium]|jgi:ribosomal subunit interface protein|nr:ribosome-associated translation inhibitor RaiA [Pseudonocardiaceae bacterium]
MDIVVKGRNVEVPEHYRALVTSKLSRLERYDRKLLHFDVELFHEPNRRQHKSCQRVEITTRVRGQAVRAEACAADFYGALDCAISKLENRLRRMHDRRRVHHGRRSPASVGQATAGGVPDVAPVPASVAVLEVETTISTDAVRTAADIPVPRGVDDDEGYRPGRVVRDKEHPAKPMTVDQALYEMELVGHDFYLFSDADSGQPSVVYRRKGFDYGVIRLA